MAWDLIKEIFFAIGSLAGVIALSRPIFENKLQRDIERVNHVKELIKEQQIVDLEYYVYSVRRIPQKVLSPFDQLQHEDRSNQDVVRFSGPTSSMLTRELRGIIEAYSRLRDYVQVPEWQPVAHEEGDGEKHYWEFNKMAFADSDGIPKNYAKHLDSAAEQAERIKHAFQRFQIASELHLLEIPFARWLLRRRFSRYNILQEDK